MWRPTLIATITALAWGGCKRETDQPSPGFEISGIYFTPEEIDTISSLSPVPERPPSPTNRFADNPAAAQLGQFLFYDTRLSENGEVSCATCHQPDQGWSDGKTVSEGLETVTRNAPTLFNLAFSRWFFWDGRKDSLWSQSLGPIEADKEMGGSRLQTYHLIAEDADLRSAYEKVFGTVPDLEIVQPPRSGFPSEDASAPMSQAWASLSESDQERVNHVFAHVGKAIEAYERRLISTDSPFDTFVAKLKERATESMPLSVAATRGLKIFVGNGQCTFCHSGPQFNDLEFHNIGLDRGEFGLDTGRYDAVNAVKRDPFNGLGPYSDDRTLEGNKALFFVALKPNNLGEFKTPTLRNIAQTAPYMHDGRFSTLAEVVQFYSELNQEPALGHREETLIPLGLSPQDIDDLVAFLETLTGKPLPDELLRQPDRP